MEPMMPEGLQELEQGKINADIAEEQVLRLLGVRGEWRLPVRVLGVDGNFFKGELLSLEGPPREGVHLKIHEMCMVQVSKEVSGCYSHEVIVIDKKYISDWRQ